MLNLCLVKDKDLGQVANKLLSLSFYSNLETESFSPLKFVILEACDKHELTAVT